MISFVNITEEEFLSTKLLYKRLPLERALNWLNTRSIWFSNPAEWKDPFERRFIDAHYIQNGERRNFNWSDRLYCSCFSQTISSEALWHTYSPLNTCIEFRIIRKSLLDILEKISDYTVYIGKVEYMQTADITKTSIKAIPFNPPIGPVESNNTGARLFLLKRKSFEYENEIRVIIVGNNATGKKGLPIKYDCRNNELISKIVLDPELPDDTANMLKDLFENKYGFNPTNNGSKRVLRSVLYRKRPPAVISLD